MLILCNPLCKDGLPIPFIGYVCLGVSPMCSTTGAICQTIQTTAGSNAGGNSKNKECSKPGSGNCCDQGDCGK